MLDHPRPAVLRGTRIDLTFPVNPMYMEIRQSSRGGHMAVYIEIDRIFEDDKCVRYRFSLTDGRCGELKFDKDTGQATCEKPMPGDDEGLLYARSVRKVHLAWKEGRFPGRLIWAS